MKVRIRRLLLAAALSLAGGSAAGALDGPGRALKASGVLRLQSDAELASLGPGVASKEFIVPYAGTIRIRWKMRSNTLSGLPSTVAVYTTADECTRSTTSNIYQNQSCDLRVATGDVVLVQVAGGIDGAFPYNGFMRNVRIYFTLFDAPGVGAVTMD